MQTSFNKRCEATLRLKRGTILVTNTLFVERIVGGLDALTFTISASFLALLILADYVLSIFDEKGVSMNGEHNLFESVLRVFLLVGVEAQGAAACST